MIPTARRVARLPRLDGGRSQWSSTPASYGPVESIRVHGVQVTARRDTTDRRDLVTTTLTMWCPTNAPWAVGDQAIYDGLAYTVDSADDYSTGPAGAPVGGIVVTASRKDG